MKELSTSALRRRRSQLLLKLPPLESVLRGSLITRFKRCGKSGCRCADGPGHGPKYYLSVSLPGERPQMDYVSQEDQPVVEEYLTNYRSTRDLLEQISNINRELLRRKEKL